MPLAGVGPGQLVAGRDVEDDDVGVVAGHELAGVGVEQQVAGVVLVAPPAGRERRRASKPASTPLPLS